MFRAIDYWVNPFTAKLREQGTKHPDIQRLMKWWKMDDRFSRTYTVDEYVQMMDEAGIELSLIPAIQMQSYQVRDMIRDISIEDIADLARQSHGRIAGLYGINPYRRMDGVRELEKAVKEYGFKGAHLHCYGFGMPINARDFWPYYAKCVELDVPVVMQIGHSAELMPSECARPILLDDIALYFPELKIVGAHTGWPWVEEAIAMAWKHPNVYLGTTAHRPKYWDPKLLSFINSRGMGKVLFGTDFPALLPKESVDEIQALNIREEAKKLLLRDVAVKIFKLEAKTS